MWQPITVPNIADHSMNQSCVSIMYIKISGAHRTKSTTTFGSLPKLTPGAHHPKSAAQMSMDGVTSGCT